MGACRVRTKAPAPTSRTSHAWIPSTADSAERCASCTAPRPRSSAKARLSLCGCSKEKRGWRRRPKPSATQKGRQRRRRPRTSDSSPLKLLQNGGDVVEGNLLGNALEYLWSTERIKSCPQRYTACSTAKKHALTQNRQKHETQTSAIAHQHARKRTNTKTHKGIQYSHAAHKAHTAHHDMQRIYSIQHIQRTKHVKLIHHVPHIKRILHIHHT